MYACSVGHADITEYLLQKGADPNFHHGICFKSILLIIHMCTRCPKMDWLILIYWEFTGTQAYQ